jgi:hypothetical protein
MNAKSVTVTMKFCSRIYLLQVLSSECQSVNIKMKFAIGHRVDAPLGKRSLFVLVFVNLTDLLSLLTQYVYVNIICFF